MSRSISTAIVAGLVSVALGLVYAPGLNGGFHFDDQANIFSNESIHLHELSGDSLLQALQGGHAGPSGRPVSQITFALNHYFGGFDAFAFKATNLVIHGFTGLLAFLLVLRLFRALRVPVSEAILRNSAALVTAVWLFHPIQLLAVLHVVQRMASLSALFLFAALLLHIHAREQRGRVSLFVAWAVLWPLSFLSKETGALFPVFALAYELIIRRVIVQRLDPFGRMLTWTVGFVIIAAVAYSISPTGRWLFAGYEMRGFSLVERLLTEARVLWFYAGLIVLPRLGAFGLHHDDIGVSTTVFDPWTTLPAVIGVACLAALAWMARRPAPVVAFGIVWFLVGHSLESTFLPLEIAHEHRNYVPLLGLLLPVGWGVGMLLQRKGIHRTVGLLVGLVMVGYSGFVTALRADLYGDETIRTQIEAQFHPDSARANFDAGRVWNAVALTESGPSPAAQFASYYYLRAGELDPAFKSNWIGLIQIDCRQSGKAQPRWVDELAKRMLRTPLAPGDRTTLYNMKEMAVAGSLCLDRSDFERVFAAVVANKSASTSLKAMAYSWLADYLTLEAGDLAAAQGALDRSLAFAPHNASNRLKRAQLAFLLGDRRNSDSILSSVSEEYLTSSERKTRAMLVSCLNAGDTSVICLGR